ncbi:DUF1654 domain-containing protein [Pseudomonas syringae]|nr:DUF1654 domain-containing protein [Pseudomonas syringae]
MSSLTPDITEHESYIALAQRIQSIICSPKAQIDHQALISREEGESAHNWERLVSEIRDSEGVSISRCDDGRFLVTWFVTPET